MDDFLWLAFIAFAISFQCFYMIGSMLVAQVAVARQATLHCLAKELDSVLGRQIHRIKQNVGMATKGNSNLALESVQGSPHDA
jgi:hypothetical protein